MTVFKGLFVEDSTGVIIEYYFTKRVKSFHEALRVLRGYIVYWDLNDIVECGFIEKRPDSKWEKARKWHYVRMTKETLDSMCKTLEEAGILKPVKTKKFWE